MANVPSLSYRLQHNPLDQLAVGWIDCSQDDDFLCDGIFRKQGNLTQVGKQTTLSAIFSQNRQNIPGDIVRLNAR